MGDQWVLRFGSGAQKDRLGELDDWKMKITATTIFSEVQTSCCILHLNTLSLLSFYPNPPTPPPRTLNPIKKYNSASLALHSKSCPSLPAPCSCIDGRRADDVDVGGDECHDDGGVHDEGDVCVIEGQVGDVCEGGHGDCIGLDEDECGDV
jgi:hypothetical protein